MPGAEPLAFDIGSRGSILSALSAAGDLRSQYTEWEELKLAHKFPEGWSFSRSVLNFFTQKSGLYVCKELLRGFIFVEGETLEAVDPTGILAEKKL